MTLKLAINGFGRIGRGVLRALVESGDGDIDIVAINDLAPAASLAHLLKYDSIHGRFPASISVEGEAIFVDGKMIRMTSERAPEDLPWSDVDIALECTGHFTNREGAARHLQNGAKRVLISAPGTNADKTIVYGVNHGTITPDDVVLSNASCTTNCLAPLAMVLDDAIGIETGYMTTIHAYTGDQPTHDSPHRDPYRARAASVSMIPTSTGAARAISLVLPQLEGRLEGSAIRVPTPNVSLVDLSFMPKRQVTREEIDALIKTAADGPLNGILSYGDEPLVSIDFNHDSHSSCYAAAETTVTQAGLVRVVSWYDNEWGFSNRMLDTARHIGRVMEAESDGSLAANG